MVKRHIFWRLIAVYWSSKNRWYGIALLAGTVGLNLSQVWAQARLALLQASFFDSLQKLNKSLFRVTIIQMVLCLVLVVVFTAGGVYLQGRLQIDWRKKLTESYVGRWLQDKAIYRIEREGYTDNPDQRISMDLDMYVAQTLLLAVGLVTALSRVFSFIGVLWVKSGPLKFVVDGTMWTIPAYLVWVAIAYAVITTFITRLVARPVVSLTQEQQHREADFRFNLTQVREHAEQVALYRSAPTEGRRLGILFNAIVTNWHSLIAYTFRLSIFTSGFNTLAAVFFFAVMSPRVLSGELSVGNMMVMEASFLVVLQSLGWFVTSYDQVAIWLAVVNRLNGLEQALLAPPVTGIRINTVSKLPITVSGLRLSLPEGVELTKIDDFSIHPGQRWLIRGASGAGKSTLIRAIAGLWPYGSGYIEKPSGSAILFLPQKSYLPTGSLKMTLAYPGDAAAFSDEHCIRALVDCRLGHLAGRLMEVGRWEQQLSPGEQQRLSFARALLMRPDFLFLDEATSAVDIATEQKLYQLLLRDMPNTALITVTHGNDLDAFHTHQLNVAAAR